MGFVKNCSYLPLPSSLSGSLNIQQKKMVTANYLKRIKSNKFLQENYQKEGIFFTFLDYFQKQRENFRLFSEKHPP